MTKLYTKRGDDGKSQAAPDYGKEEQRARKCNFNFELGGSIDELNAHVGMARTMLLQLKETSTDTRYVGSIYGMLDDLKKVQNDLLDIGSHLFQRTVWKMPVEWYEQAIDGYTAATPELSEFVLPGGTMVNAQLHICRTLARKFERNLAQEATKNGEVWHYHGKFANRLSDFFFAMARYEIHLTGGLEHRWEKRDLRTGFIKEEPAWNSIPTRNIQ